MHDGVPVPTRAVLSLLTLAWCCVAASAAGAADLIGGPGGGAFTDQCPPGQYVIGAGVNAGAWMDAIVPMCGNFNPDTGLMSGPLPANRHGGNGGGAQAPVFCNSQQYVDSVMFTYTQENGLPKYIASIEFHCVPIKAGGPSGRVRTGGGPANLPHGGRSCGDGQAVIGLAGRSGAYVDALGPICGTRPKPIKKTGKAKSDPCVEYAARAVADVKKANELGCNFSGARWTPAYNDHFNWCKSLKPADLGYLKSETDARQAAFATCHQKAATPPAGNVGSTPPQPCPPNKIRYSNGTCGCPPGLQGPNCDVPAVH